MSHMIDMTNDRANFAYVGAPAWHGLGSELPENASFDTWLSAAGMAHRLKSAPLSFTLPSGVQSAAEGRKAIYRDDNNKFLADVGDNV